MKIIGITGGIGSGKSEVARAFYELGADVVDADKISRFLMEKDGASYNLVVKEFGEEILNDDRTINRKKLAEIVFSDKVKLEILNTLTHKCIFEEMQNQIDSSEKEVVCLDVPLLFSSDFPFKCDFTIGVIAPKEKRIIRVMERENCTREEVLARIKNQITDTEIEERADYIIENDGSIVNLKEQVKGLYNIFV